MMALRLPSNLTHLLVALAWFVAIHASAAADPLVRVGVLADSQFQTGAVRPRVFLYRGGLEDLLVDVAIRPLALDRYSHRLLDVAVAGLEREQLDVVLYLGDGANNGCSDELEGVLDTLSKFQRRRQIPVLFVLGNHDYLGAGNTTRTRDRLRFCNPTVLEASGMASIASNDEMSTRTKKFNRPLTKFEAMERISAFNHRSFEPGSQPGLDSWIYEDTFDRPGSKAMHEFCVERLAKKIERNAWFGLATQQHVMEGCFLAGMATLFRNGKNVDFVLLDTSDYWGTWFRLSPMGRGWFGVNGWLSTSGAGSQEAWFDRGGATRSDLRVLASHYPPGDLGGLSRIFPFRRPVDQIRRLYLPPGQGAGNVWLAGHKHRDTRRDDFSVSVRPFRPWSRVRVKSLIVGSTTDASRHWGRTIGPHGAVVEIDSSGALAFQKVSAAPGNCREISELIAKQTQPAPEPPLYLPVGEATRGAELFGIDRAYRSWSPAEESNAGANLALLVDMLEKRHHFERARVEACIALESSRFEAKADRLD